MQSKFWFATSAVAIIALVMMATPVQAQTVTLTPSAPQNYWAGVNTTNNLTTNVLSVVELGGGATTNINLAVSGVNGTTVFGPLTPNTLTSNGTSVLKISVTNAANNFYTITVNASGDATASTGLNLFVVPQWAQTNVGSTGNWSDSTKWSGGAAPLGTDSVYIEHQIPGAWTNVVDSSSTIQSLIYLGDADDNSVTACPDTVIAPGQTLSVVGTNGFFIGRKAAGGQRPNYVFQGESLLVSNSAALFAIEDANANGTRFTRVRMDGLNNLTVDVNRFAIADGSVANNGAQSVQSIVDYYLARTNFIRATLTGDYSGATFTTAISYNRQIGQMNNAQWSANAIFRLGISNVFNADSIGIGIGDGNGSGSSAFANSVGSRMAFSSVNPTAPTNSVVFRNADGVSRMSLLALGVDQGLKTAFSGNRGLMDLQGGKVDMLVDQIWLGQDRTNSADAHGFDCIGGLYFTWGTVDCNTLLAGNMKYTNNIGGTGCRGYVIVGTNGTMIVNNNLILGQTPANVTGFESQAALVGGQIRIDNGGTLRANQINVGQFSGNNIIIINAGGTLEVSNTLASATTALGTLTINSGGALTLHKNEANTLVYVTNLVASGGIINIASVTGAGSFAPLIAYAPGGGEAASFIAGSVPSGYNATLFNNTTTHTIDLTLTTGTPKTLLWQGYVNGNWDTTTKNWLDTATLLHTNFSTGDSVIFDDSASFATVNVTEDVVPRQATGFNGMAMTNNLLDYTFSGAGGIRGAASFVKAGTKSVTVNNYTEVAVQVVQGLLTGSGTLGTVTVSPGATCSLLAGGVVLGGVTCGGTVVNAGTVKGALAAQALSVVTNGVGGVIQGPLSTSNGSFIYNAGTFSGMGSATIATNAIFINAGSLANGGNNAGSLAVNGTFEDMGNAVGTVVNLTSLTINGGGTFIPGGDGIGTTTVVNDGLAANNGRVVFLTGSTNIFKVNVGGSPANTLLTCGYMSFGPNQSTLIQNGGTILMTNIGSTPFGVGQSFKLVGNNFGGTLFNSGLNTTNSLSVINPSVPSSGLAWDLSQLIGGGVIGIKTIATTGTNLVFNTALTQTISTNVPPVTNNVIVVGLSWPTDHTGWTLQQQQNTLDVGLSTNWTSLTVSQFTNNMVLTNAVTTNTAVFYRMVSP